MSEIGTVFDRNNRNRLQSVKLTCLATLLVLFAGQTTPGQEVPVDSAVKDSAVKVTLQNENGSWKLLRDGELYYVKGAGGASASLEDLAAAGANSNRTWGVGKKTRARLDEAHRNGLSVAVGIWLEHERLKKIDYSQPDQVEKQAQEVLAHVEALKDHPAVLVWGIGNEMEGEGDDVAIWKHIEDVAGRIKKIDPNHPTMTVIAEASELKIRSLHEHCPSIDIVGINAYGGADSLPQRYRKNGGTKPYLVTEFGPTGTWEIGRNYFDAVDEASVPEKIEMYRKSYNAFMADSELCLGSYAFLWGNKQEATTTWFGMLLSDGKRLGTADAMSELWSSKPAENKCPVIESFQLEGSDWVLPESKLKLKLKYSDAENDKVQVRWILRPEADTYVTGGDFQETPEPIENAFANQSADGSEVNLPATEGIYRVYVFVEDDLHRNAATANIPVKVTREAMKEPENIGLPLVVYDEPGQANERAYVLSGFMGANHALLVDATCIAQPKVGDRCMHIIYKNPADWAGVVWQHPANDWGDRPGGFDLTGAKKLTFWAKGKSGGEEIKFGFGLLGDDKKFPDSGKGEIAVKLTDDWVQYSVDCDADLHQIKSGFYWSLTGQGHPVEFFLDRIVYE